MTWHFQSNSMRRSFTNSSHFNLCGSAKCSTKTMLCNFYTCCLCFRCFLTILIKYPQFCRSFYRIWIFTQLFRHHMRIHSSFIHIVKLDWQKFTSKMFCLKCSGYNTDLIHWHHQSLKSLCVHITLNMYSSASDVDALTLLVFHFGF